MKKKIFLLLMSILAYSGFAQTNIYNAYNGSFELGNISNWRAVEVVSGVLLSIESDITESSILISNDSNSGDYAAEFTWGVDPTINDIVFDLSTPLVPATNYIFRASSKSTSGPCILRIHATFYDSNNAILSDYNDATWQLTNTYTQHEWAIPTSPAGTSYAVIGFRAFNTNGSRWPATAVTTLIDDVELWENYVGQEHTLTTNLVGTGSGYITLNPSGGTYQVGTQVTVTATPYYQSEFVSWSGDASGSINPTVITIDGDKNVSAIINDQIFSFVEMTNDSDAGANAVKFTWRTNPNIEDIVFDISPNILPNTDYFFRAKAKSESGPCILRIHADFYDASNALISSYNDASWQLTNTYAQHDWALPTSPANTSNVVIGFRVFNTDGSRWPVTDIVTIIDEVQLWNSLPLSIDVQEIDELYRLKVFPNPFSSATTLSYNLREASFVEVSIFNSFGSLVGTLVQKDQSIGLHNINWNGGHLPSGIYFVRLNVSNGNTQVVKMIINK